MQAGIVQALQKTWRRCARRPHVQNNKRGKRTRQEKGDRSMQTRHAIAERYHLRRKFVESFTLPVLTVKECDSSCLAQRLQDCGESADEF